MSRDILYVTRPQLPPLSEFVAELERIWDSRILTNCGPYHQRLEAALGEMLGVANISLFTNGTVAIQHALDALDLRGEIITTPFTFVATAHCILKAGCTPVFVDVDPATLNIDASQIEAAITPATVAIMPVHCYGLSCDVAAIEDIARRRGLAVVYDAAHAFGVRDRGGSILRHGDLSVLSFHATKVFNTFEGGAVISRTPELKQRIDKLRNFGFVDEVTVVEVGGNGKMCEMNAALGLLQIRYFDQAVAARRRVDAIYRERLSRVRGIRCVGIPTHQHHNHSYFPILVEPGYGSSREDLYRRFREADIFARRYFYPLVSDLPMYRHLPSAHPGRLPRAVDAADRVLCLPIFPDMRDEQVEAVLKVIEDGP